MDERTGHMRQDPLEAVQQALAGFVDQVVVRNGKYFFKGKLDPDRDENWD